jgi:hypothetical protein
MRITCLIAAPAALTAALTAAPMPAAAWGPTGHRVTAKLAEARLNPVARAHVRAILGSESLAEASTWPDDQRSNPDPFWQKTASPWHYVTVPTGQPYTTAMAPAEGDAVTALAQFRTTLRDAHAPLADRQRALRFAVHIIGDLQQPLHAGRPGDRGGNSVAVTWMGRPTNLHAVWDAAMIDDRQLSYTEYAAFLARTITPERARAWADVRPATWINESATLRETIYPTDPALGYKYNWQHIGEVNTRLAMGGVRIAAWLNAVWR